MHMRITYVKHESHFLTEFHDGQGFSSGDIAATAALHASGSIWTISVSSILYVCN